MNKPSSLVEQCLKVYLHAYGLNHVEDIINNFVTDLRDKYKSLFDEFGPIAQKRYDFSRKICRVVFDNDGHIFGGYVRDTLYGNWFKDMDIEFNFTKESYKKFYNNLCWIGNVTQIDGKTYKSQLIKLRVTDTTDPDRISIDLDIVNASFFNWGIDFDVNALETSVEKKPSWQLSNWEINNSCQLEGLFIESRYGYKIAPILNHIQNREFVVLAANREPLVSHAPYAPKPVFSKSGRIIHIISNKYQKQVCIERNWLGLKILDRMTKMKQRGWTC